MVPTTEATQVEPVNEYDFPVTGDVPAAPDKCHVPRQLEEAVAAHVPADLEVDVNTRFTRTVARMSGSTLEVSWDTYQDEEHYGGDGWAVIMSAVQKAVADWEVDA